MLFDWEKKDVDFISRKINVPLKMRFSKTKGNKLYSWTCACVSILKESRRNDCIVCWFDLQGIILYWLSIVTFHKRYICCVNLMLKDKKTVANKILSFCYRIALKSNRVRASVTSDEYGEWLNKKLGIEKKYYLVRDVFRDTYTLRETVKEKKQVFIGGVNGRDWNFAFGLAERMPDVSYCIVVNHSIYEKYKTKRLKNVELLENIPLSLFEKKLCESQLVCLPLNTSAPSGLIVLFRAAANKKMVCVTKTPSSIAYINENRGECISNNAGIWDDKIRYYLNHPNERKQKAENLYIFLKENCNEDGFVKALEKMLF